MTRLLQIALAAFVLAQVYVHWWYRRPIGSIEPPGWARVDPAHHRAAFKRISPGKPGECLVEAPHGGYRWGRCSWTSSGVMSIGAGSIMLDSPDWYPVAEATTPATTLLRDSTGIDFSGGGTQ